MIKFLNKLLRKYCWVYERIDNGDKGFVLAKSYDSAIKKLKTIYNNIDKAMENYCDTLIETLSDENFIYPPTFKKREEMLTKYLYKLEIICKTAFYDKYREY